jgi:Fe-S-cluster-containing dehydrogenase component
MVCQIPIKEYLMAKKYGILVDVERCLGCGVCVVACKQENGLPPHTDDIPGTTGISWNQVLAISEGRYPDMWEYHIPVHCMHCDNPPCVPSCPKEAITKSSEGIVVIHESKCNACTDVPDGLMKCRTACPYGAIQFNAEKGVAQICTMCIQRLSVGVEPACVRACIGRCLYCGDFNNPESEVSRMAVEAGDRLFVLSPERRTDPAIRYINPVQPKKVRVDKINPLTRVKIVYGYGSHYTKPAE